MRPGLVIADCSTAEPDSTIRIAADVEAKGGQFVDTPMTRTPKEAEAGKLGLMTGGPEDVIARIRSDFEEHGVDYPTDMIMMEIQRIERQVRTELMATD